MFYGNEAGIVPRFPSNIRCDKFGHFQHGFFNIASYYPNSLAISRFSNSPHTTTRNVKHGNGAFIFDVLDMAQTFSINADDTGQ